MDILAYSMPIVAVVALVVAALLAMNIKKQPVGTAKMKEISDYIHEGAQGFLTSEYKILAVFIVIVLLAVGLFISWGTALSFLVGAIFSTAAGYFGMNVATRANVRTANAAKEKGMSGALPIAFRGGAVMGLCVVGLGLLGVSGIYLLTGNADILFGFSLGASSMALFARVGGGIYTKAADVGADLVGKVEAGIPEDDPRNPAVIADNVGDNVGDVAGMGADLFESYVGSMISAVTLGLLPEIVSFGTQSSRGLYPLILSAIGVLASIISVFFVRGKDGTDPHKSLKLAENVSSIITVCSAILLSYFMFNSFAPCGAVIAGLIVGVLIGNVTEYYTSDKHKSVKKIADHSITGSATNIISGLAVGMQSCTIPVLLICAGILVSYLCAGVYGVALAAVGMLATTGSTVAVDAYGPIADNAGGIAEMSGLDKNVRNVTDSLDAVGNTTAAIGKGFAIGSAALTALSLFFTYSNAVQITQIDLLNEVVIVGLLIGAMLPFLFSSITMEAVSKAANKMIEEVRRQFKSDKGILEGTSKPDYKSCVSISTSAALKEMLIPGVIAIIVPILVGLFLGAEALAGLLAGALVTGVLLAIFMSNSGGAWDNAKKLIESGHNGGKGSDTHHAAVVGDTVGDPFKDTSGPSINILVKLMTIVSLVFAPLFVKYGGLIFTWFENLK